MRQRFAITVCLVSAGAISVASAASPDLSARAGFGPYANTVSHESHDPVSGASILLDLADIDGEHVLSAVLPQDQFDDISLGNAFARSGWTPSFGSLNTRDPWPAFSAPLDDLTTAFDAAPNGDPSTGSGWSSNRMGFNDARTNSGVIREIDPVHGLQAVPIPGAAAMGAFGLFGVFGARPRRR